MKHLKNSLSIAVLLATTLFWVSCQKEVSNQNLEVQTSQNSTARLGGLVPDDQNLVIKTPLIMSADFLKNGASTLNDASSNRGIKGGGSTSDVTPPTVSITSPANGATVSGTVTVKVSATDNVGVASVSFSVDGTVKSTLTKAPYTFTWDASTVIDGTHTLTATAKDAKNNAASNTITVAKNTEIIVVPPPISLPLAYQLATPPVGNQGNEFTCTPFAIAYGARAIEQYYRSNATSYSQSTNILSVEYIYNQTKAGSDCASGSAIGSCLDFLAWKGVCTNQTMAYSDVNGCSLLPTAAQDNEAANFKIAAYSKILATDQTAIKTMISQKHPVIAGIITDYSFNNATAGFIWKTYSGSGGAAHSLIICGYDDSKRAYKVMNSWGTNWGDAGFTWIDYDFFPTRSGYYLYVMNY